MKFQTARGRKLAVSMLLFMSGEVCTSVCDAASFQRQKDKARKNCLAFSKSLQGRFCQNDS